MLAARALDKQLSSLKLAVNGNAHEGALYRPFSAEALGHQPLTVSNKGDGTVQAVVSVCGAPLTPEPAAEHGFKIERNYFTLDGKPADPTHAKQNERFVVVLKVTEPQPQFGRVIVADYLPAGFEIDNPHLVSSGDTGVLRGSPTPRTGAYRIPRRPLHGGLRPQQEFAAGVHGGLCGAGGVARPLRAAAGLSSKTCTGPTASAVPVPAPSRLRRRNERRHRRGAGRAGRRSGGGCAMSSPAHGVAVVALRCRPRALRASLGPAPLGRHLDLSHLVLDRNGRLLRAYATKEGRWRLPATVKDVDPRFLKLLFAYEDKRFYEHDGVDPLAMSGAAFQWITQRPYRLGRPVR